MAEEATKLLIADLPWPVLEVSPQGSIESGNAQASRLLDLQAIGEDDLLARYQLADGAGVLGDSEVPWRKLVQLGPFSRRELWLDRQTGARLLLNVRGLVAGQTRLLVLEDESQQTLTVELAQRVATLSTELLAAQDGAAAARVVVEQVQRTLLADTVVLLNVERDRGLLSVAGAHGIPAAMLDAHRDIPMDAPLLAAEVARTHQVREIPELGELPPDAPWPRQLLELGMHSLVAAPLLAAGELVGVLTLARRQAGRLSLVERQVLDAVASACALGIQRARAHDADRRGFALLQSLRGAVSAVQEGRSHEENLRWLIDQARKLTGARYAAMGVRDPRTGQLSAFLHSGMPEEVVRRMPHPPEGHGLLGAVLTEKRPIRIRNIGRDPRSSGFPAGHPVMTTFLGVPIFVGGQVFGNFYLCDKEDGQEFSAEDEQLVVLLSAQAALMIAYSQQVRVNVEQRRTLESLLHEAPDGILFFEAAGETLLLGNPAAERLFGRRLTALGPNERIEAWGILASDGRPFDASRLPAHRALRGESPREEMIIRRPDGSRVEVSMSAAPVTVEDRVLGAVVVVQDISAYKELERVREELAAVVAHDLRNPIQSLLLGFDTLLRRAQDGQVSVPVTRVQRLQHTTARLARMASDLLESSRVELGRVTIDARAISPVQAVTELVQNIRPTLGERSVQVRVDGTPPPVLADRYRLDQILTNLLENAARYSPEGTAIELTVSGVDGGAVVAVRDHGQGIASDELPRIFDRFYQARRARRQRTGMGLGLYITRSLVEAQGGHISVESTPGQGSTFRVWLPAAPSQALTEAFTAPA